MNNAAFATYKHISRHEVIVDVESTKGWLGTCRLPIPFTMDALTVAYNEADRRAIAAGVTLQWVRPE